MYVSICKCTHICAEAKGGVFVAVYHSGLFSVSRILYSIWSKAGSHQVTGKDPCHSPVQCWDYRHVWDCTRLFCGLLPTSPSLQASSNFPLYSFGARSVSDLIILALNALVICSPLLWRTLNLKILSQSSNHCGLWSISDFWLGRLKVYLPIIILWVS